MDFSSEIIKPNSVHAIILKGMSKIIRDLIIENSNITFKNALKKYIGIVDDENSISILNELFSCIFRLEKSLYHEKLKQYVIDGKKGNKGNKLNTYVSVLIYENPQVSLKNAKKKCISAVPKVLEYDAFDEIFKLTFNAEKERYNQVLKEYLETDICITMVNMSKIDIDALEKEIKKNNITVIQPLENPIINLEPKIIRKGRELKEPSYHTRESEENADKINCLLEIEEPIVPLQSQSQFQDIVD